MEVSNSSQAALLPLGGKHWRKREAQSEKRKTGMVGHTFNPSSGRHRQVNLCGFKTNLVYIPSSRTTQ